jgi:uncharacterized protein
MPINLIDPHYLSFVTNILPRARAKGLGVLAMKSNAMGPITQNKIATIEECLRFTLTQKIDVLVSGVETLDQLENNVGVVKTFKPMSTQEISSILDRTKKGPYGSKIERYKKPESSARHKLHHDGEPA